MATLNIKNGLVLVQQRPVAVIDFCMSSPAKERRLWNKAQSLQTERWLITFNAGVKIDPSGLRRIPIPLQRRRVFLYESRVV